MKATFAAGCFWHVEEAFRGLRGATRTEVGFTGGTKENPTYEDVCSGKTGHAESVRVEYDPRRVSYSTLLKTFWGIHDPTSMNRQGNDVGSQYRSAIFYHNEAQRKAAASSMKSEQKRHTGRIVTEIVKAPRFFPAEEYHQGYLRKRGFPRVC